MSLEEDPFTKGEMHYENRIKKDVHYLINQAIRNLGGSHSAGVSIDESEARMNDYFRMLRAEN